MTIGPVNITWFFVWSIVGMAIFRDDGRWHPVEVTL
jgi:hypothetical protein